jgi:hypothetical protein
MGSISKEIDNNKIKLIIHKKDIAFLIRSSKVILSKELLGAPDQMTVSLAANRRGV